MLEQNGNMPADSSVEFTVNAKKETAFNLNLLIPDWATDVDIYINGQKQQKTISPASYYSIKRSWKNDDKVKLVFHYRFHLKPMPDDDKVLAVFYGPSLLAFETNSELILKGSQKEILKNLSVTGNNVFQLKDDGKTYVSASFV